MKINILGTEYTLIQNATAEEYPLIADCDGYCDWPAKKIVVRGEEESDNSDNFEVFINKVIRHEIIHAFFHESGLFFESSNEQNVDWIAMQVPKMAELFEELDVL